MIISLLIYIHLQTKTAAGAGIFILLTSAFDMINYPLARLAVFNEFFNMQLPRVHFNLLFASYISSETRPFFLQHNAVYRKGGSTTPYSEIK